MELRIILAITLMERVAYGKYKSYPSQMQVLTLDRWNNYHPGMAIQNLVAEAVVSALKGAFF
jgi:hypothetical protein